ncbi:type II toxin-antitoxin system RatA family toxin [uncultured Maricaulis sp.]|uniref:type II toxin-antitoxin system RatA family toxin n=1 Tax=uncultured Maricaulis sp. TaxID=174710 RepID=UPI0030DA2F61
MTVVLTETLRLYHDADDLFELVSDVRRYPDFIHQITAMRVVKEKKDGAVTQLTAEARIRYKFVTERFTSAVRADADARTIDVSFVSGPFRVLENSWRFDPLSDGSTLVKFHIKAAFRNIVLQMLLDSQRERAAHILVKRFSDEANRRFAITGDPALALRDEIDALTQ